MKGICTSMGEQFSTARTSGDMHTRSLEAGTNVGGTVILALLVVFAGVWITRNDQIGIAATGEQA